MTGRRICLIDDDIFVRDALAFGLSNDGYQVFAAPGAVVGLDIIARKHIDVIVTHINMPGITGAQLIAEARERWPDLAIIAITGADTTAGVSSDDFALQMGADTCLSKPLRAQQLAHLIETVLAARSASD